MQVYTIPINELGQELIRFPNAVFPSVFYHTVIERNSAGYIPLHWHDEWQFSIITKGNVRFQIQGTDVLLRKGDGIFINSGVIHEVHALEKEASYICWNISVRLLPNYFHEIYRNSISQNRHLPYVLLSSQVMWQQQLMDAIKAGYTLFKMKEQNYELAIYEQFIKTVRTLSSHYIGQSRQSNIVFDERVKTIVQYIHHHYDQKVTLRQLASAALLSEGETIRLFKKYLHVTPFQYLLRYRLNRSKEYLLFTDNTITAIGLIVGFSGASYYIEQFKKVFSMTPKQFRDDSKSKRYAEG